MDVQAVSLGRIRVGIDRFQIGWRREEHDQALSVGAFRIHLDLELGLRRRAPGLGQEQAAQQRSVEVALWTP